MNSCNRCDDIRLAAGKWHIFGFEHFKDVFHRTRYSIANGNWLKNYHKNLLHLQIQRFCLELNLQKEILSKFLLLQLL